MDFPEVTDALLQHAKAAGQNLDNPITDVAFAHPIPTSSRCIRLYYTGEVAPVRMGGQRVLNGELVSERLVIVGFWALSNARETYAATVEREVYQLKHELRTRILADSDLGGVSTDLALGYAEVDWGVNNGTVYRTLEMEVITDYGEYTIAK